MCGASSCWSLSGRDPVAACPSCLKEYTWTLHSALCPDIQGTAASSPSVGDPGPLQICRSAPQMSGFAAEPDSSGLWLLHWFLPLCSAVASLLGVAPTGSAPAWPVRGAGLAVGASCLRARTSSSQWGSQAAMTQTVERLTGSPAVPSRGAISVSASPRQTGSHRDPVQQELSCRESLYGAGWARHTGSPCPWWKQDTPPHSQGGP